MRAIVGISGASGAIYAVRLLETFKDLGVETHLTITKVAEDVITSETGLTKGEIISLATHFYDVKDLTAPIASGSFKVDGMVIIPCSMKTLAGIASGYTSNLLLRAADVTLKERRKLIIVPRETPLHTIHLLNMYKVALAGAVVLPATPAFYHKPKSINDLVNHVVGKILDVLDIEHNLYKKWGSN